MRKFNLLQILITIAAVVLTSVVIAFGWTAPTGGPPGNDVPPPINSGPDAQTKIGGLILGTGVSSTQSALVIPIGNFSIGTSALKTKGSLGGFINAQDVWLRDAAGGAGAWASSLSGGAGGASNLGQGSVPSRYSSNGSCYWVNPYLTRWHYDVCSPGYMVRGIEFQADNNWDQGNTLCCKIDLSLPTYCRRPDTTDVRPAGGTVAGLGACRVSPPPDCSGPPYYSCSQSGWVSGTQDILTYTCQSDGTWAQTVTGSQSCSIYQDIQCFDSSYCIIAGA